MEVRTGKTLTALGIAKEMKPRRLLFLTKKKAISSIQSDYDALAPEYDIEVINYESLHKVEGSFDFVILDEAHGMGAFPKPSKRAKDVKALIERDNPHVILLSGTPTPESFSQMYHQVYAIPNNPFSGYKNFYRFADDYVTVKQQKFGPRIVNDYSEGSLEIIDEMEPYTISFTQKQAGFESEIDEEILWVDIDPRVIETIRRLKTYRVVEGKEEQIIGDTPAKLMQKVHQLCSGTIKFESGNRKVLDVSKAKAIKKKFSGNKIGIFYKFVAELEAIKQVFGKENVTQEINVFNDTDCQVIALQIVSGREGISLRNADYLVFYNIDFSATSYWQARDRMTTKDRKYNKVYWVFSRGGIENDIYKTVLDKKSYTTQHFKTIPSKELDKAPSNYTGKKTEYFCMECGVKITEDFGPGGAMGIPCDSPSECKSEI